MDLWYGGGINMQIVNVMMTPNFMFFCRIEQWWLMIMASIEWEAQSGPITNSIWDLRWSNHVKMWENRQSKKIYVQNVNVFYWGNPWYIFNPHHTETFPTHHFVRRCQLRDSNPLLSGCGQSWRVFFLPPPKKNTKNSFFFTPNPRNKVVFFWL